MAHQLVAGLTTLVKCSLKTLEVAPNVLLSTPQDMRLPLRWIAILCDRINANLAATGGIHTGQDVLKLLMVGANITMLCKAITKFSASL